MTLYDVLVDKMAEHTVKAIKSFSDSKQISKHVSASEMCKELIDLLSDDTLGMEVTTRAQVIGKTKG